MIAAIVALLCLAGMFYFSGPVSFFCFVGMFGAAMVAAMDFYAEKKNENWSNNEGSNQDAPEPQAADTNPAQVSNGYQTDGIQNGKGFLRTNEQASAGHYDDPAAPADTVTTGNVGAPAKPGKNIELEI